MPASYKTALDRMKQVYFDSDRPWVIGFSGGKDSTALLQLVFLLHTVLPTKSLTKPIHVVSNDTLVEIPQVAAMVVETLHKIEVSAPKLGYPISVAQTHPELEESFFVNLIGKGYPSPTTRFRWCTERLKINPTSEYIKRLVSQRGEVVILLGARKEESATRAQALANTEIPGSLLRRHSTLPRSYVFTPIDDWSSQDVWTFLLQMPSPWGSDNRELFKLYGKASGGECPLVIDESTPSCGNSRFGCWVCTVVEQDRAVQGLVQTGEEQLQPLLDFRNFLKEVRGNRELRERVRKNGQLRNQAGDEVWGPFTLEGRKAILRKLLETEMLVGFPLITVAELTLIQKLWHRGGISLSGPQADIGFSVAQLIRQVKGGSEMRQVEEFFGEELPAEDELLKEICARHNLEPEVLQRLKAAEEKVAHLQRRDGIFTDIDEILDQTLPAFVGSTHAD